MQNHFFVAPQVFGIFFSVGVDLRVIDVRDCKGMVLYLVCIEFFCTNIRGRYQMSVPLKFPFTKSEARV